MGAHSAYKRQKPQPNVLSKSSLKNSNGLPNLNEKLDPKVITKILKEAAYDEQKQKLLGNPRGNVVEDDDYMYSTMKNNTFNNTNRHVGDSNYARISSNLRKNSSSRSPRKSGGEVPSARFMNPKTVNGSIAPLDSKKVNVKS